MKQCYAGLLFAVFGFACGGGEATSKNSTAPIDTSSEQRVVAVIGDVNITMAELDKSSAAEVKRAKTAYAQQLAEIRRGALDALIQQKLLKLELKKRGLKSLDELVKAEIIDKVSTPTDADLKAFYDENKDEIGAAPFEAIKDRIQTYLVGQAREERTQEFLDELRSGHSVEDRLEPHRVAVGRHGPGKGPVDARITIVEYADFECPFCSQTSKTVLEVQKKYPKDVRVVFRHFPLSFHANAMPAAIATRCADQQGKFWEMHDKMFEQSKHLSTAVIESSAKEIGLDGEKFTACMNDDSQREAVESEMEEGSAFGVEGTPAFFVNGIPLGGAQPFDAFEELVKRELQRK